MSGAFLLALFFRLIPARTSLIDGDVLFFGYDSIYQIRRILCPAGNLPSTLWFGSYSTILRAGSDVTPPL